MNLKNVLLLPVLIGCLTSCVKPPETEDKESTADEVFDVVATSWGDVDPFDIQKGEFVSLETTQKVETNPEPFFTLREGLTVSDRIEDTANNATKFKFLYQFDILRGEVQSPQSTKEDERVYQRATTASASAKLLTSSAFSVNAELQQNDFQAFADDSTMILGFERAAFLANQCYTSVKEQEACAEEGFDSCERKCVNLKVEEVVRPVPKLIQEQPNCGGYENCQWRTKMISFDLIQSFKLNSVTETYRVNFLATIVPELPFLARLLDFCYRQLLTIKTQDPNDPMNGRKVLVNSCTSLTNYKPAPPLPTP